jgi:hypothetical protein
MNATMGSRLNTLAMNFSVSHTRELILILIAHEVLHVLLIT